MVQLNLKQVLWPVCNLLNSMIYNDREHFSIHNVPFGVCSCIKFPEVQFVATRYNSHIISLVHLAKAGLFKNILTDAEAVFGQVHTLTSKIHKTLLFRNH